jgi:hypothetical protein
MKSESIEDPVKVLINSFMSSRGASVETDIEPSLQLLFNNRTIHDVMREGNIALTTDTVILLESITIKVLLSIYCAPCYKLSSDSIRNEWKSFGIDAITCAKLFTVFECGRRSLSSAIDEQRNLASSMLEFTPPNDP